VTVISTEDVTQAQPDALQFSPDASVCRPSEGQGRSRSCGEARRSVALKFSCALVLAVVTGAGIGIAVRGDAMTSRRLPVERVAAVVAGLGGLTLAPVLIGLNRLIRRRQQGAVELAPGGESLENNPGLADMIFEVAGCGLLLTDRCGTILRANQAVERMFGYRREELTGQPIEVFIPACRREPDVNHPVERHRHSGTDLPGRHKSGTELVVRVVVMPIGNGAKRVMLYSIVDLTADRWLQTALLDTRHHWESMIDTIDGVVWEADPSTFQFLFVSRQAEHLLGYPVSAWTEEPTFWIDHVHPWDRDRVVAFCRQETEAGRSHTIEYRMRAADGRTVWVKDLVVVDRPASGPTTLRGLLVDMTSVKQAERGMAVQYELAMLTTGDSALDDMAVRILHSLCSNLEWDAGCLWIVDERASLLRPFAVWNSSDDQPQRFTETARPWTLCAGEGLAGRAWANQMVEWSDNPAHLWPWTEGADSPAPQSESGVAFPVTVKQRTVAVIELVSLIRRKPDDAMTAMLQGVGIHLGLYLDRLQTEERLRASEHRFREAMETTTDGVWDWDLRTQHAYHSPAWVRMLGLEDHPIPLNNINDWRLRVHQDDLPRFDAMRAELGRADAPDQFALEHRLRHRSGQWKWVLMRGRVVVRDEGRVPLRAMGVAQDLTDRIRMEESLRHAAQELRIKNDELRQARDEALRAAQAKARFLAAMSHEIRTPMNGVIGMTDLLLETALTNEQRRMLQTVKSSGDTLLALINDILDYSKIEAGKLELDRVDFDLRLCLEETTDLLAERAYGKGLELVLLIEAGVPDWVSGDPTRVRQILLNLIGNAVKFTERGEVVVRVVPYAALASSSNQVGVKFEVQDTGIGIKPEDQGRLFHVFSQVDASTTRKYGGTGLGLAIAKRLVELMGGEIGVDSQEGRGSCFWFAVPFGVARSRPVASGEPPVSLVSRSILCVDDHGASRLAVRQLVSAWGMTMLEVTTGSEALAVLRSEAQAGRPIGVALIDLQLPDMTGYELAKAITADPALAPTKLIAVTAVGRRGDAQAAHAAGFAAYLQKPLRQAALKECVQTVLGQAAGETGRAEPIVTRHTLREAKKRPKILLAEDNQVNQLVAVKMLEKLGCAVDVVSNGIQAVEAAQQGGYALILMDCMMPELDGFAATRSIRELERRGSLATRLPIIALTASALADDRQSCLDAGMDDFLAKPIRKEDLAAMLDRWIGRRGKDRSAAVDQVTREDPSTAKEEHA
jgi:PAS domain S-box-containing protein